MNTLELRHIRKSFDGQGVLEDISLSVPAGSVTAIIGPSGSGKSTLLRCATLLETADGGDIIYEGKYAAKDGVYAPKTELHAIRRYFGLVFQSYNLWPHMTVYDNMECQELLDLLAENQVSHCYFGHIHGQYAAQKALVGEYKGVHMRLISADYVQFCPVRVE